MAGGVALPGAKIDPTKTDAAATALLVDAVMAAIATASEQLLLLSEPGASPGSIEAVSKAADELMTAVALMSAAQGAGGAQAAGGKAAGADAPGGSSRWGAAVLGPEVGDAEVQRILLRLATWTRPISTGEQYLVNGILGTGGGGRCLVVCVRCWGKNEGGSGLGRGWGGVNRAGCGVGG